MQEDIIRLRNVKKVFQTDEVETHALIDIHMEIKRGEYVSISGPSGCGKTTVGRTLLRLEAATAGTIHAVSKPAAAPNPAPGTFADAVRRKFGG